MRKITLITFLLGAMAITPMAIAAEAQKTFTGPKGQTATRSGSANCADGSCTRSGSVAGPQGKTVTGSGSASCADGSCSRSGSATGPQGKTATRSGSVQRTP